MPSTLAWICLYLAIAVDVAGVFLLAGADGLRNPLLVGLALVAFAVELAAFAVALTGIEASIAYALYGLGTAVVAVVSITMLGEPASPLKVAALALIVAGVIALNTATMSGEPGTTAPR